MSILLFIYFHRPMSQKIAFLRYFVWEMKQFMNSGLSEWRLGIGHKDAPYLGLTL